MKNTQYFPMEWITDPQNQDLHSVPCSLSVASLSFNWSEQSKIWQHKFYKNKEENTAYCFCKKSQLQGCFNSSRTGNLLPKNMKPDRKYLYDPSFPL